MSVKVFFEIGHDSSLKAKPTPEGFTHDWELFVRGCDNHDVSHFVEKVVFNLHESFPKPKRVIKESPYAVKESGYAGFVLSIDIYVKNREDPKKISFSYDLDLNMIQRKQTEKFIFTNPSEDFRRKLLKGGGVLLANTTSNLDEKSRDDERAKGKMSAIGVNDAVKKHKMRPEDPFTNLFGTPITKTSTKVSPDPKSKASPNRLGKPQLPPGGPAGGKSGDKSAAGAKEKVDKESKSKHSNRERSDGKESRKGEHERREEKKKDRNHSKDRDKSKEKSVKRPPSPKRSPKRSSPARSSQTVAAKVDDKSQPTAERSSSSSKKLKKEKKEKSHDKGERKEHKKDSVGVEKVTTTGKSSAATAEKVDAVKVTAAKEVSQGPKELREKLKEMIKTPPEITVSVDVPKVAERRVEKHEKEGERKHKHKKKDKGSSREKKKEKSGSGSRSRDDASATPTKAAAKVAQETTKTHPAFVADKKTAAATPLDKLYNELGDGVSSDSDMESPVSEKTDAATVACENSNSSAQDVPKVVEEVKSSKKSRADKKSSAEKKKKRNREEVVSEAAASGGKDSPAISKMDPPTKIPRRSGDDLYKNGDAAGAANFASATATDEGSSYRTGGGASGGGGVSSTAGNPPLSMDYMSELKDLQHKIMTLQDNNELQQVVEMIAATGQYEITSKTFDFDLCALDKNTVQRLQEFFATS